MARWRDVWAVALLLAALRAAASDERGRVEILAEAVAPDAAAPRALRVYLPPGYAQEPQRLYSTSRQIGFREGSELRLVIDAEGAHNEASSARRLPGALRFLFGPAGAP